MKGAILWPGRDRLSGIVKVDESCLGGEKRGMRGRAAAAKGLVMVATQEDGDKIVRIRLRRVFDGLLFGRIHFSF